MGGPAKNLEKLKDGAKGSWIPLDITAWQKEKREEVEEELAKEYQAKHNQPMSEQEKVWHVKKDPRSRPWSDFELGFCLDVCRAEGIHISELKVFNGRAGWYFAQTLQRYIMYSNMPIQEFHLSGNQMSSEDLVGILKAMVNSKVYPATSYSQEHQKSVALPVWFRFERNMKFKKSEFVEQLAELQGVQICQQKNEMGHISDCTPMGYCIHQHTWDLDKLSAAIHIPFATVKTLSEQPDELVTMRDEEDGNQQASSVWIGDLDDKGRNKRKGKGKGKGKGQAKGKGS